MDFEGLWFALQIRPRRERLAATILQAKGYHIFNPSCSCRYRRSNRLVEYEKPLFPGYLFCKSRPGVSEKMITTPGVICFVGIAGHPTPVSEAEIEDVRRIIDTRSPAEPWRYISHGSTVRIRTGPLAGMHGILESRSSARRLVVSVTLLQRSIAVVLPNDTMVESLMSRTVGYPNLAPPQAQYSVSGESDSLRLFHSR